MGGMGPVLSFYVSKFIPIFLRFGPRECKQPLHRCDPSQPNEIGPPAALPPALRETSFTCYFTIVYIIIIFFCSN